MTSWNLIKHAFGMLWLALLVFALAAYWRLSASLPGAALENGAGIGDTWRATEGTLGTFLMATVLLVVLGVLLGLLMGVLMLIPVIGFLIYIALQWFLTMFTLSLLTTVYGYYIEKRELV